MKLIVHGFENKGVIPDHFAFCKPDPDQKVIFSDNTNPRVEWSDAPEGTKSFALIMHDPDAPSTAVDVNQEGRTVSKDLKRADFFHWLVCDIPTERHIISEGEDAHGVTQKGKMPGQKGYGKTGLNNYTQWFAGDEGMEGNYGGYDGPCPPWNDEIPHRYIFTVYALGVTKLDIADEFDGPELLKAIKEVTLAKAEYSGTFTLNANLRES